TLEIIVELVRDQAFIEQRLVSAHLPAQRRLAKRPDLESRKEVGILPAQRVESDAGALVAETDHLTGDLRQAFAKEGADPALVERQQSVHQPSRDKQQLDPLGEACGKRTDNAKMAVKEIRHAKQRRKGQCLRGRPAIPRSAFITSTLRQRVGVLQQD